MIQNVSPKVVVLELDQASIIKQSSRCLLRHMQAVNMSLCNYRTALTGYNRHPWLVMNMASSGICNMDFCRLAMLAFLYRLANLQFDMLCFV